LISSVLTGVIKLCVFRGTALSGVVKNVLSGVPRVCSWDCSEVCAQCVLFGALGGMLIVVVRGVLRVVLRDVLRAVPRGILRGQCVIQVFFPQGYTLSSRMCSEMC